MTVIRQPENTLAEAREALIAAEYALDGYGATVSLAKVRAALTALRESSEAFVCPNCHEDSFPDEVGTVVCGECSAVIETYDGAIVSHPEASGSPTLREALREEVVGMLERQADSIRASFKSENEWNRAQASAYDQAAIKVRLGWPALLDAALASAGVGGGEPTAETTCGRFYAHPEPRDYGFCYLPKGHEGDCVFEPRHSRETNEEPA